MKLGSRVQNGRDFRKRVATAASLAVVLALGLTACTDDPTTDSTAGAGSQECIAAADKFLEPWNELPTSLPASPPARYTPLTKPVPAGGSAIALTTPIPSAQESSNAFVEAAKAAGWSAKNLNFDGSVPDLLAKFDQAISAKPTAIWVQAFPAAAMQEQLDAAKAAGIVVGMASVVDQPESYPGFAAVSNGGVTIEEIGRLHANWFMRDSRCAGNVAIFTLPFPIVEKGDQVFTDTVKANCPKCKVSSSLIQPQDLGTPKTASTIVSKLQSDPTTKYAFTVIGNLANGVAPALKQAGINDIRIFGSSPDAESMAALRNGSNAWWVNQNSVMQGWASFDSILRAVTSEQIQPDPGNYPLSVLTSNNVSDGTEVPVIPTNYQSDFKALWGVD
ncbi:sugar ABC transporter substrate-binding protein [Williamsia muralis]|nr:substrate-binding domain-containing protein [Williamsia marianensis]